MKNIFLILYALVTGIACDHERINEFISKILAENPNKVMYFMTDCCVNSSKIVIKMIDELMSEQANTNVNVITVPVNQNAEIAHPSIFTNNFQQLRDVFENYVCLSSVAYEESKHLDGMAAVISYTTKQMHQQDVAFIFLGALHENLTTPSFMETVRTYKIPMNVVWLKNTNVPLAYENIAKNTGGRIFIYGAENSNRKNILYQENVIPEKDNFNYEMTIVKKILEGDTRTQFALPTLTFYIILTINGDVTKALLISPSGIIINITPQNEETKKENNKSRKSIIVFKSPIANSPANWTFSGSGDKYDVTLIFLMNRKASRIKDQLQERNYNIYDNVINTKDESQSELNNKMSNEKQTRANVGLEKRQDNGNLIIRDFGQLKTSALTNNFFFEPIINSVSTTIDVDPLSTFFVFPKEEAKILFNVQNKKPIASMYFFDCYYLQQPCFVAPRHINLNPQQRIRVLVTVRVEGSDGSSNIVSLISRSIDFTDKKVYLFVEKQKSDNKKPDINYEYNGNCDDANTGNTCHKKRWSADICAQDTGSGLLNFWSEPGDLIYTTEFIVGTKDQICGRYSSSCCNPKVDIIALDLKSNSVRVTLDVEHQFLSTIEIIAIILAAILLIFIIIGIVYCILRWRRKRNEQSFLRN